MYVIGLKRYQLFEMRIRRNDIGRMCVCVCVKEISKGVKIIVGINDKLLRENKMQFPSHTLGVLTGAKILIVKYFVCRCAYSESANFIVEIPLAMYSNFTHLTRPLFA